MPPYCASADDLARIYGVIQEAIAGLPKAA
jgi:hypothetical protein